MVEEFLETFDENGMPTGKSVSRTEAHRNGILHGASHTYIYRIVDGRIQILLQRRSDQKDSFPGCLDISSAGHVEAGMDFPTTAIKELREELGITVDMQEIQEAFKQKYSAVNEFHGEVFNNQEINVIYTLEKDVDISSLVPQSEEVSELVWMDVEEIQKRIEENDKEICIDSKEFGRVSKIIEERMQLKKMSLNNENFDKKIVKDQFTKKIYENTVILGRFTNSNIMGRLLDKRDANGNIILPNTVIKKRNGC